jgi:hypothetical protein
MSQKGKSWSEITIREKIVRVQHLERVLVNLTPHQIKEHFDMGDWVYNPNVDGEAKAPPICGTSACAAGWASLDPWFRRNGFTSQIHCSTFTDNVENGEDKLVTSFDHAFNGMEPANFFGDSINENIFTNNELTCQHGPAAHKEVLKRVRTYIDLLKGIEIVEKAQNKLDLVFVGDDY